jgi:hypothetical protein
VKKRIKIPEAVLVRARAAVEQAPAKKPTPPPHASPKKPIAREKVIAALKKLHPMD